MKDKTTVKLAIFASGSGSNAENIFHYFEHHPCIQVAKVFTNNQEAGVIHRFENKPVEIVVFRASEFKHPDFLSHLVGVDFIVLAGFLLLVPPYLVNAYAGRMVNIHPSLLPKYGGKGMYGMNVHEAVIAANEKESGITIHFVNEVFDKGEILFQEKLKMEKDDTAETLASKIHLLEYKFFPVIIEKTIKDQHRC